MLFWQNLRIADLSSQIKTAMSRSSLSLRNFTRKGVYFPESGLKEISTTNLNAAAENARRF